MTSFSTLFQSQWFILALVFLTAGLIAYCISYPFLGRKRATERLEKLLPGKKPSGGDKTKKPSLMEQEDRGFIAKVAAPLHKVILPSKEAAQKKARLELLQAGFRSNKAFRNYLAAKVLLGILFPLSYLSRLVVLQYEPDMLVICILLALAGFYLPHLWLRYLMAKRKREIFKGLPDALDLMVVCVEAGLGLDITFKRVGDEIRPISPSLGDEFNLTNQEIRVGKSRDDAYRDLALRTGVREVHNLMTILCQTSRFGTSVARALKVHADAMRVKRRQMAEEIAAKAAVKLAFPLVFFIFPSLLVVILGPAAIRVIKVLIPVLSG